MPSMLVLKWGGVGCLGASALVLALSIVLNPSSLPNRLWSAYVAHLELRLRNLFIVGKGRSVARAQLLVLGILAAFMVSFDSGILQLSAALVLVGPVVYIDYLRRQRISEIDEKIDGFAL